MNQSSSIPFWSGVLTPCRILEAQACQDMSRFQLACSRPLRNCKSALPQSLKRFRRSATSMSVLGLVFLDLFGSFWSSWWWAKRHGQHRIGIFNIFQLDFLMPFFRRFSFHSSGSREHWQALLQDSARDSLTLFAWNVCLAEI